MELPFPQLRRSRIFQRILLGFGLVVVSLSVGVIVSYQQFLRLQENFSRLLEHESRLAEDTTLLQRQLTLVQSNKRGYLLTGNAEFRDRYEEALAQIDPVLSRLMVETTMRPVEREHLYRFRAAFSRYLQVSARDIAVRERALQEGRGLDAITPALRTAHSLDLADTADAALRSLHAAAALAVLEGQREVTDEQYASRRTALFSMLLSLAVTLLYGAWLARDIGGGLEALKRAIESREANPDGEPGPASRRTDEIGDVARSFDQLSRSLAQTETTLRDTVDAQQSLLDALQQANAALGRAMRVKSDFLATMSHELRTPLNAVIGLSAMLLESPAEQLSPRARHSLATMRDSGAHLLTLLNDILDLAKLDAGRMRFTAVALNPIALVRACVATVLPLVGDRPVQVHFDEASAPALAVRADPQRLRQVMLNLLSNAVKFTPRGEVTVRLRAEEDALAFDVEDTGIGIGPDDLPHLFEEFHQAHGGDARPYAGTGLGLPLSRRMAQAMGGDIAVHSVLGRGSRFTLRMPASAEAPIDAPEVSA